MAEVGIRALKQNASGVVARAVAGETITITDRGRPVGQLSPIPEAALDRLRAAGRVRTPLRELSQLAPPGEGPTLSKALAEMRDAERY